MSRILFVCDAGPAIGGGHVMRCLTLAGALTARGAEVAFLETPETAPVLDAFASVDLDQRLSELYTSLVENTTSRIVLMQYHLAIPSSALAYSSSQLEMMTELLNGIIADEAGQVSASRITVISPPRFDIGIDMSPQYPSNFSCSYLGYKVDGPSVQSTLTQDELLVNHPLSFCSGPAVGPPWIISGDTGIHPSAAGYMHMASQVPAPGS